VPGGTTAAVDTCTIAPERRSRIPGASSASTRTADRRFRSSASCHSSSGMARPDLCGRAPPTVWTRTSTSPSCSWAAVASASAPARVCTSAATNAAPSGGVLVADLAVVRTWAPASRNRRTMPAPIPRVPPVTRARFPASSRIPDPFSTVVMPAVLSIASWFARQKQVDAILRRIRATPRRAVPPYVRKRTEHKDAIPVGAIGTPYADAPSCAPPGPRSSPRHGTARHGTARCDIT
jgi:hypothetical protein